MAWAVVAGLTANLLTHEPLGSVPLGLLLVAAGVSGGQRLFARLWWAYPVLGAAVGSAVVDAVGLGVMLVIDPPVSGAIPFERILAAALLNAVLTAVVILPARAWGARMRGKPAW